MKMLLGCLDVLEVIKNEMNPLVEGTTDAQRATHKEGKKKDFNALFLSINVWMVTTLKKLVIVNRQSKCGKY